jgi:hypothetical protein
MLAQDLSRDLQIGGIIIYYENVCHKPFPDLPRKTKGFSPSSECIPHYPGTKKKTSLFVFVTTASLRQDCNVRLLILSLRRSVLSHR